MKLSPYPFILEEDKHATAVSENAINARIWIPKTGVLELESHGSQSKMARAPGTPHRSQIVQVADLNPLRSAEHK